MRETTDTEGASIDDGRTVDSVFDALSHRYRRYVLYCLQDGSGSVPIEEVLEYLAARDGPEPSAENEEAIRAELRSVHLPKLAEENFVDFDEEVVTLAGPTPQLLMHLEMAKRAELSQN